LVILAGFSYICGCGCFRLVAILWCKVSIEIGLELELRMVVLTVVVTTCLAVLFKVSELCVHL